MLYSVSDTVFKAVVWGKPYKTSQIEMHLVMGETDVCGVECSNWILVHRSKSGEATPY